MKRQFAEEGKKIKHMKSSESLVIREVPIKTALLNYFIPIRLAKLKGSILSSVDGKLRIQGNLCIIGRSVDNFGHNK